MNAPQHKLSVVICTYNRARDLGVTLDALSDFPCREIIVVDNGCTDETSAVLQDHPTVRVVRLPTNVGVPGFAVGVGCAMSPYVLLLDDDAIPERAVSQRLITAFDADPTLAAIACHVVAPHGDAVTDRWPDHPLLFWGCGAGIRRTLVDDFWPMFYPRLRLHGTELDLCIRLYSAGLKVRYDADAVVVHRFSGVNRSDGRRLRSITYASVRFAWDHFRVRYALVATARTLRSRARRVRSASGLLGWIRGVLDVVRDIPDIAQRRRVAPPDVEGAYFTGVWEYQPIGAKHRSQGMPRLSQGTTNP